MRRWSTRPKSKDLTINEGRNKPKVTKKTVKGAERTQWVNRMQAKPALKIHMELSQHKTELTII